MKEMIAVGSYIIAFLFGVIVALISVVIMNRMDMKKDERRAGNN
jgi:uncharacterized protein (DUF2062 family)